MGLEWLFHVFRRFAPACGDSLWQRTGLPDKETRELPGCVKAAKTGIHKPRQKTFGCIASR
jgi:hypothetical protein